MPEARKSRFYKDLEVWQVSLDLGKNIYEVSGEFPPVKRFGLTRQIHRAAVPLPSNPAEGQFRNAAKDFAQSFSMALGSAAALKTQINYGQGNMTFI
jgi:four helix bundle protein